MENTGFGLAPLRVEGGLIDPETLGTVTTPERAAEVRAYYARKYAERVAWERSLAGRWAAFTAPWRRAWVAFRDKDSGY